jgi:transposase-like protein
MRDVIRYSEAFKARLVEEVAGGKYRSLDEAGRRNGIRGCATLDRRIKQYGRAETVPYPGAGTGRGGGKDRQGPVF